MKYTMLINRLQLAVVSKLRAVVHFAPSHFRPDKVEMATKEDPSSKQLRIQVWFDLFEPAKNHGLMGYSTPFSAAWNLSQNVEGGCVL